ncbi:MAG TPA: hypothetical protein VMB21_12435 [Candidatus Limnocylindria bacterium]|nr:hypothetical protein [Candidatus Limnocylindria bacterium]
MGRRNILVWGLLGACWGRADISVPTPLEDLARRADAVVHGRVASLEVTTNAAGGIFTRVELEATEVWKGPATNHFSLIFGGGVLGGRWTKVVGGPEFRLGEEVVVFTILNPAGDAVTLDLAQGKFVVRETKDGRKMLSNGVLGDPGATAGYRLPTQVPLPLEEVKRRVETIK